MLTSPFGRSKTFFSDIARQVPACEREYEPWDRSLTARNPVCYSAAGSSPIAFTNDFMTFSPLKLLANVRPVTLIAAVIVLKAIVFFVFVPALEGRLSSLYGISFADNYQLLGENMAEGNGYRFTYETALTLMREPGYPVFLSALFAAFGFSLTAARAANLVFSFISALLVSQIAGKVSPLPAPQRIAPLLFMVHPGVFITEMRGGVEGLFVMLLLCFIVATYKALESKRLLDYLLAGVVLGIASNVRSTALLFPPFLLVYFFFWERARPTLVTMATRVTIMVAGSVLALSPWIIRNYELVHKFAPTASVAGVSAHAGYYICTHLSFDNQLEKVDSDAATERARMATERGAKFRDVSGLYYLYFYDVRDELAFNGWLGGWVAQQYLKTPTLLFQCAAKNAFNFWFAGKSWTSTALNAAGQLPYMIFALAGLYFGLRSGRPGPTGVLMLFIIYTLGIYLPILAQARYSIHLIPILSLLASVSLSRIGQARPTEPVTPSVAAS